MEIDIRNKTEYYCMKYGVTAHLEKSGCKETAKAYAAKLLGRINYVLSVEPDNSQMRQYQEWLVAQKL